MSSQTFRPRPPLVETPAHQDCRACVIVPVRNEEDTLAATLDALAGQVDASGRSLPAHSFEILLLLNNCTDQSAAVTRQWAREHPHVTLHVCVVDLPPEQAHVGTARRLLMDTAWQRLHRHGPRRGILSTDSDTIAAPDWVARNLAALDQGADAVGGVIQWKPGNLEQLTPGVRQAFWRDFRYQRLVARLEDLLDPQPGDPWPRHLHHFGASLACTTEIYARVGGMPPVKPLEDAAFVDALRASDARLRHDPSVIVYTSSRLDGRAEVGLSHQLRLWQQMAEESLPHQVPSAAWLTHRFRWLRRLRRLHRASGSGNLEAYPLQWRGVLHAAQHTTHSIGQFLAEIDCNRLIEETFRGQREGAIPAVNRNLVRVIRRTAGPYALM